MKLLDALFLSLFILDTVFLTAQPAGTLADLSLQPPKMITNPSDQYTYDSLDYGMNMGIEKTLRGRFWMCWTAGGDDPNSFMLLASSDDKGKTWSVPRLAVDGRIKGIDQSRTVQNGNLWTDPSGNLWFFFDQAMMDFDGRAGVWYTICRNPDAASPKWSAPKRLWHGTAKSKPIVLKNGDWILPVSLLNRRIIYKHSDYVDAYHGLDSLRKAHVFASRDKGRTWVRRGGVRFPNPSFDEHHLIEMRDGRLWMTARTNDGIWQTFSSDNGVSWSSPEKFLEHVSSRHFIRRLASGNILLVKHGRLNERTKKRSHLHAYLSDDEGQTWKGGILLDEREGVSYPDGFQDDDGAIYVTYDFNRSSHGHIYMVRFTEKDILNKSASGSAERALIYRPLGIQEREKKSSTGSISSDLEFLKLPQGFYFGEVSGVAVNSKGHIFVLNRGKHPLVEFSPNGAFLRTIGDELFLRGHGLRIDRHDNLWITDREAHIVLQLSSEGRVMTVLGRWKQASADSTLFNQPTDLAFDREDNIYVTDGYGNARVVKYDRYGNYIKTWGTEGNGPGEFSLPHTIVIDENDKIYVGDRNNNRIQIFDSDGALLEIWSGIGSPWGLTIKGDRLYMVDGHNNRLTVLDREGRILQTFGRKGKRSGEFEFAHMLTVDREGDIYVAEILNWRVQKISNLR